MRCTCADRLGELPHSAALERAVFPFERGMTLRSRESLRDDEENSDMAGVPAMIGRNAILAGQSVHSNATHQPKPVKLAADQVGAWLAAGRRKFWRGLAQ